MSPSEDDGPYVVLSRCQREEGLLPAQAKEPLHQLLLLSPRRAQMEGLSQSLELRSRQEV